MEETLKDLSGDLQMIHQSLERAEVVERQLGKYWREFAEERDHLRAENERLKSGDLGEAYNCGEQKIVDLLGAANAREKQLRAEVERLRANYEQFTTLCKATEERERTALNTVAGLRRALDGLIAAAKCIRHWHDTGKNGEGMIVSNAKVHELWAETAKADTALAASPGDHERQIKVEVLRATASELESLRDHIQEHIGPDDARDDIRRICWNRAKDLRDEADRLEAPNATR